MKIEAGKSYRRADGKKAGPMKVGSLGVFYTDEPGTEYREYHSDGRHYWSTPDYDLVAEWTDETTGPVRTVTRKEIVPGSYGRVRVDFGAEGGSIMLGLFSQSGAVERSYQFNADELRAAAATLTEIADALTTPTA